MLLREKTCGFESIVFKEPFNSLERGSNKEILSFYKSLASVKESFNKFGANFISYLRNPKFNVRINVDFFLVIFALMMLRIL